MVFAVILIVIKIQSHLVVLVIGNKYILVSFIAATEKEDTEKEEEDKDMAVVEKLLPKITAEKEKLKEEDEMLLKVRKNIIYQFSSFKIISKLCQTFPVNWNIYVVT